MILKDEFDPLSLHSNKKAIKIDQEHTSIKKLERSKMKFCLQVNMISMKILDDLLRVINDFYRHDDVKN